MKFTCKKNKIQIKSHNFYKNPFPIIFTNLKSLMPKYLWLIFIFVILLEIPFYHSFNLNKLKLDIFLNSSIAGLSLIPVLFGAMFGIFKDEELIKLVIFKRKKDKEYNGKAFEGIIAPFVLASIIFMIIGSSSLLLLNISIPMEIKNIIKLIYLNMLLLGIFVLFATVICIFQNYYYNVVNNTEFFLNEKMKKQK